MRLRDARVDAEVAELQEVFVIRRLLVCYMRSCSLKRFPGVKLLGGMKPELSGGGWMQVKPHMCGCS